MFFLRIAAAVLAFVAASVYGVAIALSRRDKGRVAYDYARRIDWWARPLLNLRVTLKGERALEDHRPCVFVANHQSLLDVPVLARCYRPGAVVIAKKELVNIPFFGWLYDVTGNIRIDRKDTTQSVGRLKEAEEAIRSRRVAVWIFPEGTRGKEAGVMLPFKKGGFVMAVNTGAPIVPVVASPLKPRSDIQKLRLRRNDVEVRVLDPIPTAGLGDADIPALMTETRRRMYAALAEMSLARGIAPPEEARAALAAYGSGGGTAVGLPSGAPSATGSPAGGGGSGASPGDGGGGSSAPSGPASASS